MIVRRERLEGGAGRAEGTVIVVDVIRAFTTAAFALNAGAREIRLFSSPEEALAAREPGAFVMGEVGGAPPPGFDHGNSPALLPNEAVRGRLVLQRTGLGTRCAVAATKATRLFAASLVVAQATVRAVRASSQGEVVTIVESGGEPEGDDAVADHLEQLLRDEPPDLARTLGRVRTCRAARELLEGGRGHSPPQDLACCIAVDLFDFAIAVERTDGRVVARKATPWV